MPDIFARPHHPYTQALLAAIPEHNQGAARLAALPGMVPGRDDRPGGCLFAPRCKYVVAGCNQARPALEPVAPVAPVAQASARALVRCIKPLNVASETLNGGAR